GRLRPDAVLVAGGYVAGPVGLAAALRRVPLVLSEADSRLGLANRLLAPFARRVCLAFPLARRTGARYLVTGRPVPPEIAAAGFTPTSRRSPIPLRLPTSSSPERADRCSSWPPRARRRCSSPIPTRRRITSRGTRAGWKRPARQSSFRTRSSTRRGSLAWSA